MFWHALCDCQLNRWRWHTYNKTQRFIYNSKHRNISKEAGTFMLYEPKHTLMVTERENFFPKTCYILTNFIRLPLSSSFIILGPKIYTSEGNVNYKLNPTAPNASIFESETSTSYEISENLSRQLYRNLLSGISPISLQLV